MIIDIEQRNNQSKSELFISYFNVNGNIDYITIPLKPKDLFNWAEADGAYNADGSGKVTWDNKPIKKINKIIEASVQKIKMLENECQILARIEEERKK